MQVLKDGPLSSFRSQMVVFISVTLLVTAIALSFFNRQLEERTATVVAEYIRDITLATDTVYRSFSSGDYLYDMVNRNEPESLRVSGESVIRHLLVVDEQGLVFDSSSEDDLRRPYQSVLDEIAEPSANRRPPDGSVVEGGAQRSLRFSIETDRGLRQIFIVISMGRLSQVRETGDRVRLVALSVFGVGLIVVIIAFTLRITRPITQLGGAARRVTRGEIDFEVPAAGPREVSRLISTFNEMLAGLRRSRDLEEKLQRAERSAVVGRLASGIAHEIRNPLNFINLSIDYLRDKHRPADQTGVDEYQRILTTIKDEIGRLNSLVSNFLSYGRSAKLRYREVDACVLVSEVRDLLSTTAAQQGVSIRIISLNAEKNSEESGALLTAPILADPEYLRTCFSNIMINALQAMPEGGLLTVAFRCTPARLAIDFSDNGQGMTAEMCEQVFEPYFSTKETGVGLGLALTRKIVEEHGGKISVNSQPGTGTTFHLELPTTPPDARAGEDGSIP